MEQSKLHKRPDQKNSQQDVLDEAISLTFLTRNNMSVLSFLQSTASASILGEPELSSINISINNLQKNLNSYFKSGIEDHFLFGSVTRGTILPRYIDGCSDIDYMIVFYDDGCKPQTYLSRLRLFVEKYYSRSEIYQSSPTIVIELNHIKFELVPAKNTWFSGYKIPDGKGDWMATRPNEFNRDLSNKNKKHNSLIKPTIRLAKYWNSQNGYIYSSFLLEKWMVDDLGYWNCYNQKDYFFHVIKSFDPYEISSQKAKDKIERAQKIVEKSLRYEAEEKSYLAEVEIKRLF